MVTKHPDRTLVLWPPYDNPMAALALKLYGGATVAYVGEDGWGCTGDGAFHDLLWSHWETVRVIDIPQWEGLHDRLRIYRREERR
jgi:hypothetical protein